MRVCYFNHTPFPIEGKRFDRLWFLFLGWRATIWFNISPHFLPCHTCSLWVSCYKTKYYCKKFENIALCVQNLMQGSYSFLWLHSVFFTYPCVIHVICYYEAGDDGSCSSWWAFTDLRHTSPLSIQVIQHFLWLEIWDKVPTALQVFPRCVASVANESQTCPQTFRPSKPPP